MKFSNRFVTLLRPMQSKTRYHTAGSQALTLIQQVLLAMFLLSGWQKTLIGLICWAVFSTFSALFIHSRMLVEKPPRRALRRVIREFEVVMSVGNAALLILLSGSITNIVILVLLYLVSASLTSELHGRRWIQFD
jgi:hypothetical protein